MPVLIGRKALRSICVCALLTGVAAGAHAAEPTLPDEAAINLDQAVQGLKDEALTFNRDALMAEDEFLYPATTRVAVYVSNRIPNLLLETLTLSVDGGAPSIFKYDEQSSRALLAKGALQPLLRQNLGRGPHRIKGQYTGRLMDGKKEQGEVGGDFEAVFDKGTGPSEVELSIVRGARKTRPAVKVREWRAAEE